MKNAILVIFTFFPLVGMASAQPPKKFDIQGKTAKKIYQNMVKNGFESHPGDVAVTYVGTVECSIPTENSSSKPVTCTVTEQ